MLFKSISEAYNHFYGKQKENYVSIDITEDENQVVSEYATNVSDLRWGQPKFRGTSKEKLHDAFFLGGAAETVAGKLFGHEQSELEFDVGGNASDYCHSDLSCIGLNIGVKVSKYGLPPMVVRKELWKDGQCGDEIICTVYEKDIERDSTGKIKRVKRVVVNGVATAEILKRYQSRDLIRNKSCEKYADRAGFYAFNHLKPLHTEEERNAFLAEYRIFN